MSKRQTENMVKLSNLYRQLLELWRDNLVLLANHIRLRNGNIGDNILWKGAEGFPGLHRSDFRPSSVGFLLSQAVILSDLADSVLEVNHAVL
jgi:hypothetical protein